MNNGYYQNPVFPGVGLNNNTIPNQQSVPSYEQSQTTVNPITSEQSYIENILRLNRGKKAKFHVTVPGSDNSLLKKFPSNIIATFGKYKEKLFFDRKDMNDDDYDDFKL